MSEEHPLTSAVAPRELELGPVRGLRHRPRPTVTAEPDRSPVALPVERGHLDSSADQLGPGGCHDLLAERGLVRHDAAYDADGAYSYDRVDGRVPHIPAVSGRDEPLGEPSQRLLSASVDRLSARQARQSEHDQNEHNRGGAGEDPGVAGFAVHVSPHEEKRGYERRRAQKSESDRLQVPGPPGLLHRQLAHGWVQRRRPPEHVENDPAHIGWTAHLPRSVQLDPAVDAVGDQQAQRPRRQEAHGHVSGPAAEHQAHEDAQDQDVADRVRDRGQLGKQGDVGRAQVRLDQVDPRQDPAPRRDDERVQHRAGVAVAPPPGPDHRCQAGDQQRNGGEVEDVGDRRERVRLVKKLGQHVVGDVARGKRRDRQGDAEPRDAVGGTVADHPDHDCRRGTQAEQAPQVHVVTGEQEDDSHERHVEGQVDPWRNRRLVRGT